MWLSSFGGKICRQNTKQMGSKPRRDEDITVSSPSSARLRSGSRGPEIWAGIRLPRRLCTKSNLPLCRLHTPPPPSSPLNSCYVVASDRPHRQGRSLSHEEYVQTNLFPMWLDSNTCKRRSLSPRPPPSPPFHKLCSHHGKTF